MSQADAQVVAVCDAKLDQLELARTAVNARYQNSDCATYADFHELLARKDIDAVLRGSKTRSCPLTLSQHVDSR